MMEIFVKVTIDIIMLGFISYINNKINKLKGYIESYFEDKMLKIHKKCKIFSYFRRRLSCNVK